LACQAKTPCGEMQSGEAVRIQMKHVFKEKNKATTQEAGLISQSPATGTQWAGASSTWCSSPASYESTRCKYSPVSPAGLFFPRPVHLFFSNANQCIFHISFFFSSNANQCTFCIFFFSNATQCISCM